MDNPTGSYKQRRLYTLKEALELLYRYAYDVSEARFLLDIDDMHAHRKFQALQTIANQMMTLWPFEIEKVLAEYEGRRNKTNGKSRNPDMIRYFVMPGLCKYNKCYLIGAFDREYVVKLCKKVYAISKGEQPTPNEIGIVTGQSLFAEGLSYASGAHNDIAGVLTDEPDSFAYTDNVIIGKPVLASNHRMRITIMGDDWTQSTFRFEGNTYGDDPLGPLGTRSATLYQLMQAYNVGAREIEEQ